MVPITCCPLLPIANVLNQYFLPGSRPLIVHRLVEQMVFTHTLWSVGGSIVYSKPKETAPLLPSTVRFSSPGFTPLTILKLEGAVSTMLWRFFLKGSRVVTRASTSPLAVLETELPYCTHNAISSTRLVFLAAMGKY